MQKRFFSLLAGFFATATLMGRAQAQPEVFTFNPPGVLPFGAPVNFVLDGVNGGFVAGPIDVATTLGIDERFYAFCVEPTTVYASPSPFTERSILDYNLGAPGTGGGLGWLYNNNIAEMLAASRPDIATRAAGLQMAIWEVGYDWNGSLFAPGGAAGAGVDLTSGRIRFDALTNNAAVIAAANDFITVWGGRSEDATWLQIDNFGPRTAFGQDLIGPRPLPRGRVPEPGTLALLGTGVVAFRLIRRRR